FSVDFYYEKDTANPQFTWYFGDGSPLSHKANPRHTYKQPGTYKVSVRVTDAEGRAGTDDWSIDVESPDE
ncbi:MAG: PKD domain-containing protein, partial [Candidatus Binatia bacterium]